MIRIGDKDTSDRRTGMGEDERQPVMARLHARRRRSNLVILVTLRKGNHPGEAYVRMGRRKALYRKERDSLEGSHEQAQIQRKVLRRGKNLAFSEETCLEKEIVQSKVIPRKVEVGLKRRQELNRKRWDWRLAWWGFTKKKEASYFLGLRGRHQYSDQLSNQNRAPCMASTAVRTVGEGGPNGQIVSIKRAAHGRRQRSKKIVDEKRENYKAKNGSLLYT